MGPDRSQDKNEESDEWLIYYFLKKKTISIRINIIMYAIEKKKIEYIIFLNYHIMQMYHYSMNL
jgi:hypothetical protein